MDKPYWDFVAAMLFRGDDPNAITDAIRGALTIVATDWVEWGDGRWRTDTVCSICGAELAGVCGHERDPERRVILRREYDAAKEA